MAEIVGAVAGALALAEVAVKATTAISQLKELYKEVQGVPETLQDLAEQVSILTPFVFELDHISTTDPLLSNDAAIRSTTEYCRKSLQNLIVIVEHLRVQINSNKRLVRGLAKVKVVLKKQVLVDFEKRLQIVIGMLSSAQQSYMMAMIRLQPHIILEHMTVDKESQRHRRLGAGEETKTREIDISETKRQPPTKISKRFIEGNKSCEDGVTSYELPVKSNRWRPRLPWHGDLAIGSITARWQSATLMPDGFTEVRHDVRVQLPSWLGSKAWDIQVTKAISGWKMNLRAWRVAPDSPAIDAIENRDVQSLIYSLEAGHATLFDRDASGNTLLHLAACQPNLDILRVLLASGLDFTEISDDKYTVLGTLLYGFLLNSDCAVVEIFRLFASHAVFESSDTDESVLWQAASCIIFKEKHPGFYGSIPEISELFERRIMLPFQQLDLETRLIYALETANPSDWTSRALYSILSRNGELLMREIQQVEPLWHYLAFAISMSLHDDEDYQGWQSILAEILDAGNANLHGLWNICQARNSGVHQDYASRDLLITPLFCCLFSSIKKYWRYGYRRFVTTYQSVLEPPMLRWLSLLKGCNVDLQEYGRRERELLLGNHKLAVHCWMGQRRLHDIRYGPNPEDWALEWKEIEPRSNKAEPRLLVPGDWLDESGDYKDEMDEDFHFDWQEDLCVVLE